MSKELFPSNHVAGNYFRVAPCSTLHTGTFSPQLVHSVGTYLSCHHSILWAAMMVQARHSHTHSQAPRYTSLSTAAPPPPAPLGSLSALSPASHTAYLSLYSGLVSRLCSCGYGTDLAQVRRLAAAALPTLRSIRPSRPQPPDSLSPPA